MEIALDIKQEKKIEKAEEKPVFEVNGLNLFYGKKQALRNIQLTPRSCAASTG
jgi:ABC-type phosphate transport system ATPase subunit